MNPVWCIRTGRLDMAPVWGGDLPDLIALKTDPSVFAVMLGGVRTREQVEAELAADISMWGRLGVGMWSLRARDDGQFIGIAGMMERRDGLGIALRFALWPQARGGGLAREATVAALFFAHDRANIHRIVAVAREENFASRIVLGSIGMRVCGSFLRDGYTMLIYESVR